MMYIYRKQRTRAMKTITNPERLVSVPFSKTCCGVDFYINTGESKDICGVLTEHRTFKTDFFSFSRRIFSVSISFAAPMAMCC